uniref:Uncharacterized protein n=1 Tax=Sphaerodactylus townsendi TaxID=933632 RepID=A0ACB8EGP3_9SAUR
MVSGFSQRPTTNAGLKQSPEFPPALSLPLRHGRSIESWSGDGTGSEANCPVELGLVTLTERESRLDEVRSAFLATYSSTVALKPVSPSPSGAIGGLLEQFARGVGLRGSGIL